MVKRSGSSYGSNGKCLFCDVQVSPGGNNRREHEQGKRHREAISGEENAETYDANGKCRVCGVEIGFDPRNRMQHQQGRTHRKNVMIASQKESVTYDANGKCRVCGVKIGFDPRSRTTHEKGRKHRKNANTANATRTSAPSPPAPPARPPPARPPPPPPPPPPRFSQRHVVVSHPSDASVTAGGCVSTNVRIGTTSVTVTGSRFEYPNGRPSTDNYIVTHDLCPGPIISEPVFVTLDFLAKNVLGNFSPTFIIEFRDSRGNPFTVKRRWKVKVEDRDLQRLLAEGLGASSPYRRTVKQRLATDSASRHNGIEPGQPLRGGQTLMIFIPEQFNPTDEVRAGIEAAPGSDASEAMAERLAAAPTYYNYADMFGELLMAEETQQHINIRNYDIEPTKMFRTAAYLSLRVPGLAESRPSVMRGDKIIAVDDGGRYEGVVHVVELERVLLKFSKRLMTRWLVPSTIPVTFTRAQFTVNRTQMKLQHTGLQRAMFDGYMPFLHPAEFYVPRSVGVPLPPLAVSPYNAALNEEQINAVRASMRRGLRTPYVIFGPPGTGKTSTLIELIKQIVSTETASTQPPRAASGPLSALRNMLTRGGGGDSRTSSGQHVRVLVTAPSNAAVDNVVERLLQGGEIQPSQLLRVNAFGRSRDSVPPVVLGRSLWNDESGHFGVPSREQMRNARVVAMTCMTAARYACSEQLSGGFDFVIVDEAGQATEPETVSSFAGMMRTDRGGSLVIAGDHKQLGPIIESPLAKVRLGVSLLERLCSSGPHGPSLEGEFDADYTTMLLRNYRSHPAIIEVPSRLFYFDRLVPCADADMVRSLLSWEGLANPGPDTDFPILFHGIVGEDMREGNSPSWFNPEEALAVVRHIESLRQLRGCGFALDQVGVITPYHKQKCKLRRLLSARGMDAVRVGTTEEFQGGEKRVIIISLTRSSPEHVAFDARYHLGFVSNPQRFNVAVTRAKALLIVVGNPLLMAKDKCGWGELLRLCVDRGGYRGVQLPEDIFADEVEVEELAKNDDESAEPGAASREETHAAGLAWALDYGAEMPGNRRADE